MHCSLIPRPDPAGKSGDPIFWRTELTSQENAVRVSHIHQGRSAFLNYLFLDGFHRIEGTDPVKQCFSPEVWHSAHPQNLLYCTASAQLCNLAWKGNSGVLFVIVKLGVRCHLLFAHWVHGGLWIATKARAWDGQTELKNVLRRLKMSTRMENSPENICDLSTRQCSSL